MQQTVLTSMLAPWVARLASGVRCLWVIDRSTGTISWKSRDDYSCFREKGHLVSVFEQMAADLSRTAFADPNELTLLCKLRSRVMKKYQRYNTAHCWLYKWLFASQLESTYHTLLTRIDISLYTCLSSCRQVPELRRTNDQERLFSLLSNRQPVGQQNESLFIFLNRYPQFLSRVATETIQTNQSRILVANLLQLSRVQVAALLPNINAPLPNEGADTTSLTRDRNSPGAQRLLAIGIARLHEFGFLNQVNLEMFHPDELMQFIGERQDLIPILTGDSGSGSQNESLFNFADRYPQYLSRIAPETIQANLSNIAIANLSHLSQIQVAAILPMINVPVLTEGHENLPAQSASSSEQNENPSSEVGSSSENANPAPSPLLQDSPGAQRLMAIGIAKLYEFGLLGQVHLGMFHSDEWMRFIGDRPDLAPTLIESTIASSQNASLFAFLDQNPQFLSNVPVSFVRDHFARIPIPHLSNLSRDQVIAILPSINDLILEEGNVNSSFLFSSANWAIGARRLIAIGIAKLDEFGLLDQINLGGFDDNALFQFIGERWDLLPHMEFGGLEARLSSLPIPRIRAFDDTFLQRFSLSSLSEEAIIGVGLDRFTLGQLEQPFRRYPGLLQRDRSRIIAADVATLTPSLIAVLYDTLSNFQISQINLHAMTKEEIAVILDGQYVRIKRMDPWGIAQYYEKLPDAAKIIAPQGVYNFTEEQIRTLGIFRMSNGSSSSTTTPDSSSNSDQHSSS